MSPGPGPRPRLSAPRSTGARLGAGTALAAAVAAVLWLLLSGGPSYLVHAHFSDAGQLVSGDLVEVGGLSIGQIQNIGVTSDGQADVAMKITDGHFVPFHQGTLATIRAVGAAGVANRYVAITPGPSGAPAIAAGGVLPPTATRGIVDLDMLLDSFDKPTRQKLVSIISGSATGLGAPQAANSTLHLLNPAVSQTSLLGAELIRDRPALNSVIASSASTLRALDTGGGALGRAVTGLAGVLNTIAGRRAALADVLERTTGVLHRLEVTMGALRSTLPAVGSMLVAARPSVAPLLGVLRRVIPDGQLLAPALTDLRGQLPALYRALAGFPRLAGLGVPALAATRTAVTGLEPIFAGLRPYTLDWLAGPISQIDEQYATWDQLGHYARESILGGQASQDGLLSLLPQPPQGSLGGNPTPHYSTSLLLRCPGGAAEPGPDRSNPWLPASVMCNPRDDPK